MGTGRVSVQFDQVIGNSSSGRTDLDQNLSKMATGKLGLDVRSGPPPKQGKGDVMTAEEAVRQKADLDKATVEFKVEHVTKSIPVKAAGGKEAGWVAGHGPDDLCLRPHPGSEKRQAVFEAILTEKAIKELNRAGIKDVAKHFQSKTVRVTGKMTQRHYDGYGRPPVVEVVIDDLSQLEVVD